MLTGKFPVSLFFQRKIKYLKNPQKLFPVSKIK